MNSMAIIQTLMGNLKVKMPKNYEIVNNLMQNNGSPQDLVNQIMRNISPEQKQNLLSQCKNYGMPNEILAKLQNMK